MKNRATSTMQVSSSMTTMPPEPIMAPILVRESKSMWQVQILFGQAAAGGTADLDGLELLSVGDAAAYVKHDLTQSACPWGPRSDRCCTTLPVRAKALVPGLSGVPIAAVPLRAAAE